MAGNRRISRSGYDLKHKESSTPPVFTSTQWHVALSKELSLRKVVLLKDIHSTPDGDEIAASFSRSMRDDFGIKNITSKKSGFD